jgi:hypothetical protein
MFHTMLQVFYLDFVYICNGFQVFFRCFFASVSEAYFKCFTCLRAYVASVVSGCFKSRSGVAHRMRVENERGESGPRTQSGGTGNVRAVRAPCGCTKRRHERGPWSAGVRGKRSATQASLDVQALALLNN